MSAWQPETSDQSTRWISREFSELLADPAKCHRQPDASPPAYDVLIVGSGYGGAIAAAGLAGCVDDSGKAIRVCVLERGREHLPGSFPSQMADLPTQLRGNFGGKVKGGEGLFDLRAGGDVSAVLANGLGGGSLINAGVMEIPAREVFDGRWPSALRQRNALDPHYQHAKTLLGATVDGADNRIGRHPRHQAEPLAKTRVLKSLAPQKFREAAITIAMEDKVTSGGVQLRACKLCGDCATGCNYGAKESLDTNLLVRAYRHGADIYCGATVLRLQRTEGHRDLWSVLVTHTDEKLRLQEGGARWITVRKLILAAGSLGSTEILLRSQRAAPDLSFSALLGQRFSTNGDLISFGYDYGASAEANAVADEDQPPAERRVGPTITGVIDAVLDEEWTGATVPRIVIEELAVPGALRRVVEESVTTANTLHALGEFDRQPHAAGHPRNDPYAVHRNKIRHMTVFAAMGDDGAAGTLRLGNGADSDAGDGHLAVVWPGVGKLPLFDAQTRRIAKLASDVGYGGRTLPNPLWRFLPESMAFLINNQRGPLVTVHPLGGCPMGSSDADGVVDDRGRVFDAAAGSSALHDGLVVLDGAIVPSALSTNPALTIAALALRAVEQLRSGWQWLTPVATTADVSVRPQIADIEAEIIERSQRPRAGTVVGVTERLSGPLVLRDAQGVPRDCQVEITLTYDPLRLEHLFRPDDQGRLAQARLTVGETDRSTGLLRIFLRDEWARLQKLSLSAEDRRREEARAARSYALTGTLTILEREATRGAERTVTGLWAWLRNRGLRDSAQGAMEWASQLASGDSSDGPGLRQRILGVLQLASHAGEVRRFRYELRIGAEAPADAAAAERPVPRFEPPSQFEGAAIRGGKRISYERPSNPWRQLQDLQLTWFVGPLAAATPRRLTLEPQYLAARGRPLLRIESQRDHVEALADFASLAAYFLRMLLTIHLWNLRKPDRPRHRPIQRLPGKLPGLPAPEVHWLDVDELAGMPVRMRLTRYRRYGQAKRAASPGQPPVLLIHGYSASGTTFAHPALKPDLARYLAQTGRDVWVADLRSSAGLATATHPWTFEQVALADIPAAIDYIWWRSGQQPLDVLAHCMGAVMLGMAVLSANKTPEEVEKLLRPRDAAADTRVTDRFRSERRALPQRIRRVVLSQNGPVMVMSQQNIFRGYVMSYMEQMLGPQRYDFRPEPGQGLATELMDRFLGSLPYPDDELLQENPWQPWRRTEFLGTRHRMDALYGRTFSLRNLSAEVLDHIDDFFGPLNLDTVAQVTHFSQHQTITNRAGRNRFVTRQSLETQWPFQTLSLHGQENGLADIATLYRMEAVFEGAGRNFKGLALPGMGHQDGLIGKDAARTFAHIRSFLDDPRSGQSEARPEYWAEAPWLGPMLSRQADGSVLVGLGASPQLGRPKAICMLPVERDGAGRWVCEPLMQRLDLDPEDTLWRPKDEDTDWLTLSLPTRVADSAVRHVLVLPIYPQIACMSDDGFDPGDTNAAAARLWKRRLGARLTEGGMPAAAAQNGDGDPEHQAMAAAIERALREINRDAGPGEPPGLIHLPERNPDAASALCLALGSCQYPPGILNELPAYQSWDRLNERLDGAHAPQRDRPDLLVLTGDQVYIDATAGLFDPTLADDRYRKPYETWLRQRSVRNALRRIPMVATLDDHEIDDNWEPLAESAAPEVRDRNRQLLERGIKGFLRFQRPALWGSGPRSTSAPLWFKFEAQGIPVFMLDSRTQRQGRAANAALQGPEAMLGPQQWDELRAWLRDAPRDRPKIIVSPAVMLPRHRRAVPASLAFGGSDRNGQAARHSDGWDGYPDTSYALLDFIAERQLHGVVFLSGDEHLGLCTTARISRGRRGIDNDEVTVHSIHAPGLNTPYRFANAKASNLILDETISFRPAADTDPAAERRCTVSTRVFEGAGFAIVSLKPGPAGTDWTLSCEFDAEGACHAGALTWSAPLRIA